ncbi:beta-lactamase family protein [Mucilaginibacter daejeonensis]|uniref:beta-lactamase family protein n=1 Tax=Mucilaginibacter daejeonensis TaxID=398049 RepID=UPI001D17B1C4|nr:beta-lactamase family protein [Mucilaginibacter daejeonensis]UEG51492.1 beta-lactamase family protein [Mucilaginibacter daejeonensis]
MKNNIHLKSFFSFTLLIVYFGMIFSCSATRHSQNAILQTIDPLYKEIETVGNELTVKNNVPGVAVSVIRDGKIAWIQSIGYADLASKNQ